MGEKEQPSQRRRTQVCLCVFSEEMSFSYASHASGAAPLLFATDGGVTSGEIMVEVECCRSRRRVASDQSGTRDRLDEAPGHHLHGCRRRPGRDSPNPFALPSFFFNFILSLFIYFFFLHSYFLHNTFQLHIPPVKLLPARALGEF